MSATKKTKAEEGGPIRTKKLWRDRSIKESISQKEILDLRTWGRVWESLRGRGKLAVNT